MFLGHHLRCRYYICIFAYVFVQNPSETLGSARKQMGRLLALPRVTSLHFFFRNLQIPWVSELSCATAGANQWNRSGTQLLQIVCCRCPVFKCLGLGGLKAEDCSRFNGKLVPRKSLHGLDFWKKSVVNPGLLWKNGISKKMIPKSP